MASLIQDTTNDSSTLDSTGVRAMGRRCLASDVTCGILGMGSIFNKNNNTAFLSFYAIYMTIAAIQRHIKSFTHNQVTIMINTAKMHD